MRRRLAPILSGDDGRGGARATDRRTPDGLPVHSLTTLLADLGALTPNGVTLFRVLAPMWRAVDRKTGTG